MAVYTYIAIVLHFPTGIYELIHTENLFFVIHLHIFTLHHLRVSYNNIQAVKLQSTEDIYLISIK